MAVLSVSRQSVDLGASCLPTAARKRPDLRSNLSRQCECDRREHEDLAGGIRVAAGTCANTNRGAQNGAPEARSSAVDASIGALELARDMLATHLAWAERELDSVAGNSR